MNEASTGIGLTAIEQPDLYEDHTDTDGTRHFIKQIPEYGNRWLRVVVNVEVTPKKRITAFFDRRLGRKNEDQSR